MHLFMVRHAESASNAGLKTTKPDETPITDLGWAQAVQFAKTYKPYPFFPNLIVQSRYLRTQMTAAPFIERFFNIRVETWEVHEWAQLKSERYWQTTYDDRHQHVKAHWERNDPHLRDGEDSETYADLMQRVERMLDKASRTHGLVVMFTHGLFMRAVLWRVLVGQYEPNEMARFRKFAEAVEVPNMVTLPFMHTDNRWLAGQFKSLSV